MKKNISFESHTEKRGDYLWIRYTGFLASKDLPSGRNTFEAVADLCRENGCKKVLLDARELITELGTMDLFTLGCQLADVPDRSVRFALLGTEKQVPADNFMENVAVTRGSFMRVFTVEDEAIAWLSRPWNFQSHGRRLSNPRCVDSSSCHAVVTSEEIGIEIPYDIPKEVIAKASECDKAYKCLTKAPHELCCVRSRSVQGAVTFVKCALHTDCPFVETYTSADTVICNCPVRKEIWHRYHV